MEKVRQGQKPNSNAFYNWSVFTKLDNSKLGSTQQQKICWHWHVARIISSQKIYGLHARKHHMVEMRGDVTDAGQTNKRTTINNEVRATQPMEAGGWVSQILNWGWQLLIEIELKCFPRFSKYFPSFSCWWFCFLEERLFLASGRDLLWNWNNLLNQIILSN